MPTGARLVTAPSCELPSIHGRQPAAMPVAGHRESPMGHQFLAMGVVLALTVGVAGMPATAADHADSQPLPMPSSAAVSRPVFLDIPAQALADALEQFGALTGLPVVFDAALTQGRRSREVRGEIGPVPALQAMLEGSGLIAQSARPGRNDAMVVLRAPAVPAVSGEVPAEAARAGLVHRRYDGLMQTRIRERFCDRPLLARGTWRAAVQFHIDATGQVRAARLLDTSGDRSRDAAITAALDGMRLDWTPPATMAQPVTLLIDPRGMRLCASTP